MQTEITMKEIKLFLKKNLKLIIITSIMFFLIGSLIITYREITSYSLSKKVDMEEETSVTNQELERLYNTDPEELSPAENDILNEYLIKDAYYFTLLIEEPDYSPYNRASLLSEYILTDQIIEQLEERIGTEILPSPEQAIHNSYNQNNVLHTFTFTTGDKEVNQDLANAVYSLITNKELPILENRHIYPKDTPDLLELDTSDETEAAIVQAERNSYSPVSNVIITGIISSVLGLFFGVIIAFIREKVDSKIGYLYSYHVNKKDIVIKFEDGTNIISQPVTHLIKTPLNHEKVVMIENEKELERLSQSKIQCSNIHLVSSISDLNPSYSVEEAIILIEIGITSKKWFEQQINVLEIYEVRKKVLILDS